MNKSNDKSKNSMNNKKRSADGSLLKSSPMKSPKISKSFDRGSSDKYKNKDKDKDKGKDKGKDSDKDKKRWKPNLDLVEALNKLWNQARVKTVSKEDRSKLVDKMSSLMENKVAAIALKHDSSRTVQFVLQYGSESQFKSTFNELISHLADMSISPYAHFVVLMTIQRVVEKPFKSDKSYQSKLLAAFKGKFRKIASNATGCKVAQQILSTFPKGKTLLLKAEIYGQQANLLNLSDEAPKTFQDVIMNLSNEKKDQETDKFCQFVETLLGKEGLVDQPFTHDLVYEAVLEAGTRFPTSSSLANTLLEALIPHTRRIIVTLNGARALSILIQLASAKERKRILKALKGYMMETALHPTAYLVLVRMIEVMDDTVTLQKSLFDEIRSSADKDQRTATGEVIEKRNPIYDLVMSNGGSKLLSVVLNRNNDFPSSSNSNNNSDNNKLCILLGDSDFSIYSTITSKKSSSMRRKEHQLYLKTDLIKLCKINNDNNDKDENIIDELINSDSGVTILLGIIKTYRDNEIVEIMATSIVQSINNAVKINCDSNGKTRNIPKGLSLLMKGWCEFEKSVAKSKNDNDSGLWCDDFQKGSKNAHTIIKNTIDSISTTTKKNKKDTNDVNAIAWIDYNPACRFLCDSTLLNSTITTSVKKIFKDKKVMERLKERAEKVEACKELLKVI